MERVSAVIPNWNGAHLLPGVLASLRAQTAPVAEIIVADNGSTDASVEIAAQAGARVLPMGRNAGFAAAVNAGVRASAGNLVAILNNDVELDTAWLEGLAGGMGSAAFACGKLLNPSNPAHLDGTFDLVSRGCTPWRSGFGRPDAPEWNQPRAICCAPMTAALFRREVFEAIGYLDESFESYLEDVDFGLRCAAAGIEGRYVPEACARHRGSATLGRWHPDTVRRIARNQTWLAAKHLPRLWTWRTLVAQLLWIPVAFRHGAGWAAIRGKWEGLRSVPRFRRAKTGNFEALNRVLVQSEDEIRRLQRKTGFDLYWRLYFALT